LYGAEIWGDWSTDVNAGSQQAAYTIRTTLNVTKGESGGSIYYFQTSTDRRSIGVFSNADNSQNRFSRFTSETDNFFDAFTAFPGDAM